MGTTSMPSGSYTVTDQTTGRTYPLMVTERGTMIIGPEGTNPQGLTGTTGRRQGFGKTLERDLERGATDMIR